jgi:tRNA A-37 threonylcarbamoyl transferase component Bud32
VPPRDATTNRLKTGTFVLPPAANRQSVPGFEVLEELGRGGMGVVFKARQTTLNRIVALKTILTGVHTEKADQLRFFSEAEAVAAVRHTNVVQVYEFGHTNGLAYFAMEYLNGGSLAGLLTERGNMSALMAARVVEQIARGVQAAHDVGVVHRDLKPANILFVGTSGKDTSDGKQGPSRRLAASALTPKITDFGLAKRGGGQDLTQTGIVMGTPSYMAPEQAKGQVKFIGPSSDVYALGVVLFECLVGRPPFHGDDAALVLTRVVMEEAPPVRNFVPDVPRDLELICMKCMEKAPAARYPSAAALADDLLRFLNGEPVTIRPAGMLEKGVKWVRRYPTRAALYGVTLLAAALIGLSAGVLQMWRSADFNRKKTDAALTFAYAATERAEELQGAIEAERQRADDAANRAATAQQSEAAAREELALARSVRAVEQAHRECEAGNPARAQQLLNAVPPKFRNWEWRFVQTLCSQPAIVESTLDGDVGTATILAVSPDGKRVITADESHVRVWNVATHTIEASFDLGSVRVLRLSPDGRLLTAVSEKGEMRIWDLTTKSETIRGMVAPGNSLAGLNGDASRGFRRPAKGEPATVFDVKSNSVIATLAAPHAGQTAWSTMSADGSRVATGGADGNIHLWDAATGKLLHALAGQSGPAKALAFSPDGTRLATAGENGSVRLWDVMTGVEVFALRNSPHPITAISFSPDGSKLATVSKGTVWILDAMPPK